MCLNTPKPLQWYQMSESKASVAQRVFKEIVTPFRNTGNHRPVDGIQQRECYLKSNKGVRNLLIQEFDSIRLKMGDMSFREVLMRCTTHQKILVPAVAIPGDPGGAHPVACIPAFQLHGPLPHLPAPSSSKRTLA